MGLTAPKTSLFSLDNTMPNILCPYCKKSPAAPAPLFPFCSARCKSSDLGAWAKGEYFIKGKSIDEENAENEQAPRPADEDQDEEINN